VNQPLPSAHEWAAQELATAKFGDARLSKRLIRIVADKLINPTASIPQASGGWAATKAAYRFFASKQVSADAIRSAHAHATLQRARHHDTLLLLQDTTELNYTAHPNTTGLGHLDSALCWGLKVHSGLAATTEGVPLGLLHQEVWTRDTPQSKGASRKRPQAERESQRWLTTLAEVQELVEASTHLVVVADREADIYPLFAAPRDERTDLLVRASSNRLLVGGQKLEQVASEVSWQGSREVLIPANGSRVERTATVSIGWTSVGLPPPQNYPKAASAPRPRVQLVVVEEREPPAGVKPLRWLLWTTLSVERWEQAVQVVEYYRLRWLIERYHYVLKSGCGLEKLQLETGAALERALATFGIVAWRLLWLTYEARVKPEAPCTVVFASHEWQALYCAVYRTRQVPAEAPTLREAVRLVARLGGFLARKGDGEPGVKTIWRGLIRLEDIVDGWLLARADLDPEPSSSLMGNG
jgi:Transposase DNA-binding/Transposase Tn5 dimerisation domain